MPNIQSSSGSYLHFTCVCEEREYDKALNILGSLEKLSDGDTQKLVQDNAILLMLTHNPKGFACNCVYLPVVLSAEAVFRDE